MLVESQQARNTDCLRVTLVQTDLHWRDPKANLDLLSGKIASLKGQTDLIILPEMFTSGFTDEPEIDGVNNTASDWMKAQAKRLACAVTGSVAYKLNINKIASSAGSVFVNRLLFAKPDGELCEYDKVHLFRMAGEHKRYQAGSERKIISYKGWNLLLTVCYDLRFPVFCRNREDYDAFICVANWPEARNDHWRTLLKARAIENQAYVLGVNRIGMDGKGLHYSGDSMVIDYQGKLLIDEPNEWVKTTVLNKADLDGYRKAFPAWQDADDFSLQLKS